VSTLAASAVFAQTSVTRQPIISAKSGVIQYLEGDVFLNDKMLDTKIGKFSEMKDGSILRTTEGRAEVLLTPGSFLRMKEATSIKMYDSRLVSTRIEVLSGSISVEVSDMEKEADHSLTFIAKNAVIELRKGGIYRIDGDAGLLKVRKGEAQVEIAGVAKTVGTAKAALLNGDIQISKFDNTKGDEFDRWAQTRAGYLAVANVSAANTLVGSGYGLYNSSNMGMGSNCFGGMNGYSGFNGRWSFSPYFGMFTYVPCNGMYRDPYGYSYYSPYTVQRVYYSYNPPASVGGGSINNPRPASSTWSGPSYNSNLGYNTYSSRGDMSSYTGTSSSSVSSAATSMSSSSGSSMGGGHSSGGGGSSSGGGGHSGGGHGGR